MNRLKVWHWMLIGLVLGAVMGLAQAGFREAPVGAVGIGQAEFEALLPAAPADLRTPELKEIVVVPVGDLYWVRVLRRYASPNGAGSGYRREWLALKQKQYRPLSEFAQRAGPAYTVCQYLADMAGKYPHIRFRYAWEQDARFIVAAWTVGGTILIGVLWPIMLWALVGAGFGQQPAEAEMDLSRYGRGGEQKAAGDITSEDEHRLQAVEAQIQEDLAATASDAAAVARQTEPSAAPAQLTGGPAPAPPEPMAEKKDYSGEFYPTEVHVPHAGHEKEEGH